MANMFLELKEQYLHNIRSTCTPSPHRTTFFEYMHVVYCYTIHAGHIRYRSSRIPCDAVYISKPSNILIGDNRCLHGSRNEATVVSAWKTRQSRK